MLSSHPYRPDRKFAFTGMAVELGAIPLEAPEAEEEETPAFAGLEDDGGHFWRKRKKRRKTRRLLITRTVPKQVEEAAIEYAEDVEMPDIRPFIEAFYPRAEQIEAERLGAIEIARQALKEQEQARKEEEERRAKAAIEEADRQFRQLVAEVQEMIRQKAAKRRRMLNAVIAVVINEDEGA